MKKKFILLLLFVSVTGFNGCFSMFSVSKKLINDKALDGLDMAYMELAGKLKKEIRDMGDEEFMRNIFIGYTRILTDLRKNNSLYIMDPSKEIIDGTEETGNLIYEKMVFTKKKIKISHDELYKQFKNFVNDQPSCKDYSSKYKSYLCKVFKLAFCVHARGYDDSRVLRLIPNSCKKLHLSRISRTDYLKAVSEIRKDKALLLEFYLGEAIEFTQHLIKLFDPKVNLAVESDNWLSDTEDFDYDEEDGE